MEANRRGCEAERRHLFRSNMVYITAHIPHDVKDGSRTIASRHVGRVSVPSHTGGLPPQSSTKVHLQGQHAGFGAANAMEDFVDSEEMSLDDIEEVVAQFVTAARNAMIAGFDGVEIHGTPIHSPFNHLLPSSSKTDAILPSE